MIYDIYYYESTAYLAYINFKPNDIMIYDCNYWISENCVLCMIENTLNTSLIEQLFKTVVSLRYLPYKKIPDDCSKYVKIMSNNMYYDYLIKNILKIFIERHVNYRIIDKYSSLTNNVNQYFGLISMIDVMFQKPFNHIESLKSICAFFRIYIKTKDFNGLCTNMVLMMMRQT